MTRIIIGFALLLTFVSCKTDFSVNGEYEERAIVHFLLDPSEDYHFMKLNKTFLGDGNANTFAQVPDSSYFGLVDAVVQEVYDNQVLREWSLTDTVIDNKDENGVFYAPEQRLYYFQADLDDDGLSNIQKSDKVYRLNVEIENGKHVIFGETGLVNDVLISMPNQNNSINFMQTTTEYGAQPIRFDVGNGDVGNGEVFNTRLLFNYREVKASGTEIKTLEWDLGSLKRKDIPTTTAIVTAQGEAFYERVRNNIPIDDNVIRREVESFEIVITAGSEDINTYMLVNEPTSSLAQNKPEFSNVEGGLGIFSSRTTVTQLKPDYIAPAIRALSSNSTRELCNGSFTVPLNFCSDIPLDNTTNFSCN